MYYRGMASPPTTASGLVTKRTFLDFADDGEGISRIYAATFISDPTGLSLSAAERCDPGVAMDEDGSTKFFRMSPVTAVPEECVKSDEEDTDCHNDSASDDVGPQDGQRRRQGAPPLQEARTQTLSTAQALAQLRRGLFTRKTPLSHPAPATPGPDTATPSPAESSRTDEESTETHDSPVWRSYDSEEGGLDVGAALPAQQLVDPSAVFTPMFSAGAEQDACVAAPHSLLSAPAGAAAIIIPIYMPRPSAMALPPVMPVNMPGVMLAVARGDVAACAPRADAALAPAEGPALLPRPGGPPGAPIPGPLLAAGGWSGPQASMDSTVAVATAAMTTPSTWAVLPSPPSAAPAMNSPCIPAFFVPAVGSPPSAVCEQEHADGQRPEPSWALAATEEEQWDWPAAHPEPWNSREAPLARQHRAHQRRAMWNDEGEQPSWSPQLGQRHEEWRGRVPPPGRPQPPAGPSLWAHEAGGWHNVPEKYHVKLRRGKIPLDDLGAVVPQDIEPGAVLSEPRRLALGTDHRIHLEAAHMGDLSADQREFTKLGFDGRLSVVTEDRIHSGGRAEYVAQFTNGELSSADGVGFIFSTILPCTKNIQRITSVFANRTGHICVRANAEVVRSGVGIRPIQVGDMVSVVVDLERSVAQFTVWAMDDTPPSTAIFDFGRALERLRVRVPSVPLRSCGYFACVIKAKGVSVKLWS